MRRSDGASNIPLYTITYSYFFLKKIKKTQKWCYISSHMQYQTAYFYDVFTIDQFNKSCSIQETISWRKYQSYFCVTLINIFTGAYDLSPALRKPNM